MFAKCPADDRSHSLLWHLNGNNSLILWILRLFSFIMHYCRAQCLLCATWLMCVRLGYASSSIATRVHGASVNICSKRVIPLWIQLICRCSVASVVVTIGEPLPTPTEELNEFLISFSVRKEGIIVMILYIYNLIFLNLCSIWESFIPFSVSPLSFTSLRRLLASGWRKLELIWWIWCKLVLWAANEFIIIIVLIRNILAMQPFTSCTPSFFFSGAVQRLQWLHFPFGTCNINEFEENAFGRIPNTYLSVCIHSTARLHDQICIFCGWWVWCIPEGIDNPLNQLKCSNITNEDHFGWHLRGLQWWECYEGIVGEITQIWGKLILRRDELDYSIGECVSFVQRFFFILFLCELRIRNCEQGRKMCNANFASRQKIIQNRIDTRSAVT